MIFGRLPPGTHKDSTFSITRPDSFLVLSQTHLFPVLARILPFFATPLDSFLVLQGILPIPDTRTETRYSQIFYLFWYWPKKSFGTLTDSTYSWQLHGLYRFPVLTKILPFPLLARTVFWYSHRLTYSQYSHGFFHFSLLDRKSTRLNSSH